MSLHTFYSDPAKKKVRDEVEGVDDYARGTWSSLMFHSSPVNPVQVYDERGVEVWAECGTPSFWTEYS